MAHLASKQMLVDAIAVCDLGSIAREHPPAQVKRAFGLDPKTRKYCEEMLTNKDIDGVMIATGNFQHPKLCTAVARAGKDCYAEKPFAKVLAEVIEARDTVQDGEEVVQRPDAAAANTPGPDDDTSFTSRTSSKPCSHARIPMPRSVTLSRMRSCASWRRDPTGEGRRLYWDAATERILHHPVTEPTPTT